MDTDHAVSGYFVRRTSGAQSTTASRNSKPGLCGLWWRVFWFTSMPQVTAQQMIAVSTSAANTRSRRPRRSRGERGVGGAVTPVVIVAVIRPRSVVVRLRRSELMPSA